MAMNQQVARILLVEDDKAHTELVRRAFEAHHRRFHLTVAGSLAEARTCLAEASLDLILADLRLPDGRGNDLLPAEGEERTVPLVVMTAQGDEQVAVEAMKAEALDYVVKSEEALAGTPRIAERALREWRQIAERERAEEELHFRNEELQNEITARNKAEEDIRRINEHLSAILASTEEAIFAIAMDRHIHSCNKAAQRMLGYPESEIVGQSTAKFYPSEEAFLDFGKRLYPALEQNGYFAGEFELVRASGEIFPAEYMVNVLRSNGQELGLVVVLRDITERKRAEEERQAAAEEKAVLDAVARIITSTLDIDQVYERFAAEVKKLVDFDRVAVHVIDHDAGTFTPKYLSGVNWEGREVGAIVPLEGTLVEALLRTGRPHRREDIAAGGSFAYDEARLAAGLRSILTVPLFNKGSVAGTLGVISRRAGAYGPREQAIVERLADQIAPAVENTRLYQEAKEAEEELRQICQVSQVPIPMLGVRDETAAKLAAPDLLADDHPAKPFQMEELMARIRTILQRTPPAGLDTPRRSYAYRSGDLLIDLEGLRVFRHNQPVQLTPREWALLRVLVKNAGKVVSCRQLLKEAWGPDYGDEGEYVRSYVTRLRRKLEPDPQHPRHILLERGLGYRLVKAA
jgi:two-component system KDP operon response regulator KdpE